LDKAFFTIDDTKFISLKEIPKALEGRANNFQGIPEINLESLCHQGAPGATYTLPGADVLNRMLDTNAAIAKRGRPLLSVIQTNLAHQMSHYLSEFALRKTDGSRNMTILNFDQHIDCSASKTIGCENWGYFSACLGRVYISLLNKIGPDLEFNAFPTSNMQEKFHGRIDQSQYEQSIGQLYPLLDNKALYVTIDIDVLKGDGRTTFTEGNVEFDTFCHILSVLLDRYKKDIIGIDIIGLPPKPSMFVHEKLKEYIRDINYLMALISQAIDRP
jgi:hypothetical protein